MLINNTYHLTYCTNIHPGIDWDHTFESLKKYVPKIRDEVSNNMPFGIGLRLSNKASEELGMGNRLIDFRNWLDNNQCYVFTMNGFPYGNFHNEEVKEMVHAPDWTTQERVSYTKRLFEQLTLLIPEGISGGISTSPVSYKHWHNSDSLVHTAFEKGARNLTEIVLQLHKIEKETGKHLHLDIEPEPDGLLENSDEVVHFFTDHLLPIAIDIIKERNGIEAKLAEEMVFRYINICYDICHFSLAYEAPDETLDKFAALGIRVGKIQVSSALKIIFNDADKEEIWESLARFDESTYLHQVTEKIGDHVKTYNDLPIVLKNRKDFSELRAHFHVPIFLEKFDKLFSTQDHILKVIQYLKNHEVSNHLEIETYTWDVLPTALKTDLTSSIVREIKWLKNRL